MAIDIIQTLTMADLELLETISNVSISQMENDDKPKAGLMIGLAFIMSRKLGNPKSLDEIRAMPIAEVESIISIEEAGEDEEADVPEGVYTESP